jgi:hypothetical protein
MTTIRWWRRCRQLAALGALALGSVPLQAATVPDLYTVTVVPEGAAANRRAAAEQAAMAKLLIRVTGDRAAPLDPALRQLTSAPQEYLSSYGLDRQGRAVVGFSRARVEQALSALSLPVWGAERPLTLLWIAIDDGMGGRALVGADDTSDRAPEVPPAMTTLLGTVRAEIAAVADERGLPIVLPLLDLQDMGAVTFTDVWGGFDDRVLAASQRYRADAVLIGRVRPDLIGTTVEWLFVSGTERIGLPGAGMRDGLDAAADRYAAELRTVGGIALTAITVRNVTTAADYGRVIGYLERQSALQSVDVESYSNGTLSLRVAARGDSQVLGRVLALGGVLRPAAGDALVFDVVGAGSAQ